MDYSELKRRQSLSLDEKVQMSIERIQDWYEYWEGKVYVSFSGGKDSTVLLHLVRSIYPDVVGVFVNTGLEYPEILKFIHTIPNIITVRPKMKFKDVIDKYGYPVISKENALKIFEISSTKSKKLKNKRLYGDKNGNGKLPEKWKYLIHAPFKISSKCCNVLKKGPIKIYEKETQQKCFVGTMAKDSRLRETNYLQNGCNSFNTKRPISIPLSFWLEKDVWGYIKKNNLLYSDIYNKGYKNTGCMFCMFGVQFERPPNRFQRMKIQHPKHYDYCINKLGCGKVLDYLKINYKEPKLKSLF
jgi:3'-phosphoadenosine 5'-phosphosulfate sulfotransferase (PAPS reductase)/FAD synthetase